VTLQRQKRAAAWLGLLRRGTTEKVLPPGMVPDGPSPSAPREDTRLLQPLCTQRGRWMGRLNRDLYGRCLGNCTRFVARLLGSARAQIWHCHPDTATAAASLLRPGTQQTHPDAPNPAPQSAAELAWLTLPWGPRLPSSMGKDTSRSHEATKTSVAQAQL